MYLTPSREPPSAFAGRPFRGVCSTASVGASYSVPKASASRTALDGILEGVRRSAALHARQRLDPAAVSAPHFGQSMLTERRPETGRSGAPLSCHTLRKAKWPSRPSCNGRTAPCRCRQIARSSCGDDRHCAPRRGESQDGENARCASRSIARTLFASRTSPTFTKGLSAGGADARVVAASSRGTAPNFSAGS